MASEDASSVDMIVRQTGYDQEEARAKLAEHSGDAVAVMREYTLGGSFDREPSKDNSVNQRIYGEIRSLMDSAGKEHRRNKEAAMKQQKALEQFKSQARVLGNIASLPEQLPTEGRSYSVCADVCQVHAGGCAFSVATVASALPAHPTVVRVQVSGCARTLEADIVRSAASGAVGCILQDATKGETAMSSAFSTARRLWPAGVLVAVAYPHGPPHTVHSLEDRSPSPLEQGRVLRSREDNGALMVCSDDDFQRCITELHEQEKAGADFAITEPFYDVGTFLRFIHATRQAGVGLKIVPTLPIISTQSAFARSAAERCIRVPPGVEAMVAQLSGANPPAGDGERKAPTLPEYGEALAITAAKALLLRGVQHIHFDCASSDQAASVADKLGFGSQRDVSEKEPTSESSD